MLDKYVYGAHVSSHKLKHHSWFFICLKNVLSPLYLIHLTSRQMCSTSSASGFSNVTDACHYSEKVTGLIIIALAAPYLWSQII